MTATGLSVSSEGLRFLLPAPCPADRASGRLLAPLHPATSKGAPLPSSDDRLIAPDIAGNAPTDEALMLAYAAGDQAAMATLYDRYSDVLYGYFLHWSRNPDSAADLLQDTFLSLTKSRRSYTASAPFRHFVFRIAHNKRVSYGRALQPNVPFDETSHDLPASSSNPAQEVEDADLSGALLRAIQALPEEQREVVMLRMRGELSMEEIAEIQGAGYEAVKTRYRLAVAKIRKAVGHG